MNPYLTEDNKPNETLRYTLDYYGISLNQFKQMPDNQVEQIVRRFSDTMNDGRVIKGCHNNPTAKSIFGSKLQVEYRNGKWDSGSFSRYFSLDAWWEKRLKELPAGVQKTFPFLITPKASKVEKNRGCEGLEAKEMPHNTNMKCANCGPPVLSGTGKSCKCGSKQEVRRKLKNYHPTVKPLKLMSYLITLGSREGDIILDPFIGSGTTAIAARMMGRRYIGFETDKDYCKIARARLSAIQLELIK